MAISKTNYIPANVGNNILRLKSGIAVEMQKVNTNYSNASSLMSSGKDKALSAANAFNQTSSASISAIKDSGILVSDLTKEVEQSSRALNKCIKDGLDQAFKQYSMCSQYPLINSKDSQSSSVKSDEKRKQFKDNQEYMDASKALEELMQELAVIEEFHNQSVQNFKNIQQSADQQEFIAKNRFQNTSKNKIAGVNKQSTCNDNPFSIFAGNKSNTNMKLQANPFMF
ncbi:MAG: hypothetical protein AB1782_02910 [Cyanobacteriota bacterium]